MAKDILDVLVLSGGPSAEREVSLQSGKTIAAACEGLGHRVRVADVSPEDLSALDDPSIQLVFPILHGTFGEDGELQKELEKRGIPYVGSDSVASALAMDKGVSKKIWADAGLPTAEWAVVRRVEECSQIAFPGPWFVKPASQGSSFGASPVTEESELARVVAQGCQQWGEMLVEPMLKGTELTCGILEGVALPLISVTAQAEFFDHEAKYTRDDTEFSFDVPISVDQAAAIQRLSVEAWQALGCRDYGRVDVIIDERSGPQLLEVNTVPGFTSHSLLPLAAKRTGVEIRELVQRLLEMALKRGG